MSQSWSCGSPERSVSRDGIRQRSEHKLHKSSSSISISSSASSRPHRKDTEDMALDSIHLENSEGKQDEKPEKKKKKRKRSPSSSSLSSTTSSSEDEFKKKRKQKKTKKQQKKLKSKKKKKEKKAKKQLKKIKLAAKVEKVESKASLMIQVPVSTPVENPQSCLAVWQNDDAIEHGPVMTDEQKASFTVKRPLTKEEYDARQSVIRRVVDPETGRSRLVRGDGEILEEIVTKERHKEINKQATKEDGTAFLKKLGFKK